MGVAARPDAPTAAPLALRQGPPRHDCGQMRFMSAPANRPVEPLAQRLLAAARGGFSALALAANVLFFCALMIPVSIVKLLVSYKPVRRPVDRALNWIAMSWIGVNNAWIDAAGNRGWRVSGIDGLRRVVHPCENLGRARKQTDDREIGLGKHRAGTRRGVAVEEEGAQRVPGRVGRRCQAGEVVDIGFEPDVGERDPVAVG